MQNAPAAVRWNSSESEFSSSPSYNNFRDGAPRRSNRDFGAGERRGGGMRPQRPPPEPCETVYVGNLFFDVSADQLKAHCEQFGEVANVRIIYDARGLSKGFGYVKFNDVESATRCIEAMNNEIFEGRRAACNYAHFNNATGVRKDANSASEPTKTLFIGNLAYEMTDKDLNDLFKDINNVVDVRVSIDRRTGRPRGFAHADFLDVESATAAKEILENRVFFGRNLRLDYTFGSRATNASPRSEQ
ncbi:hypothetical protein KEM56_002568 [Ascosphaera pollenicola]|nr:hypothetical protein KEM56_002568 [Ascosphaera pollenicola]